MRVLVTGASGFLGAHLVREHIAEGDVVRCGLRATSPMKGLAGLPVEMSLVDFLDVHSLREAVRGCDAIQHLAGGFDSRAGGGSRMRSINVVGTRNLLEVARDVGVGRVVVCSSSITVGFGSRLRPGDEDTPLGELNRVYPEHSPWREYLAAKLECESIAREYCGAGMAVVIVNPDFVVGAWDRGPTSGRLILEMARRRWVPFYPGGGKCFINAVDCARGMALALRRGLPGRRYLLGNENLTYREFMTTVAQVIGRRPPALRLPACVTGAASLLGRVLPPPWQEGLGMLTAMQVERFRSGRRAREELGMPWTPIANGIEAAWRWFRACGYV